MERPGHQARPWPARVRSWGERTGSPPPSGAPTTCCPCASTRAGCGARHVTASWGRAEAVADDYGNLGEGLLALHQATGHARWLSEAGSLLHDAVERFEAADGGSTTRPTTRSRSTSARAARPTTPSRRGSRRWPVRSSASARSRATRRRSSGAGWRRRRVWDSPPATRVSAGGRWPSPRPSPPARCRSRSSERGLRPTSCSPLHGTARARCGRGRGHAGRGRHPPLADRPLAQGRPAAYVCHGFLCNLPSPRSATSRRPWPTPDSVMSDGAYPPKSAGVDRTQPGSPR